MAPLTLTVWTVLSLNIKMTGLSARVSSYNSKIAILHARSVQGLLILSAHFVRLGII